MLIREAKVQDAPAFVALFDRVNSETTFMLFERGESPTSVEQQSQMFDHWAKTDSGVMFVCEEDERTHWICCGPSGLGRRQAHSIYIAMGIRPGGGGGGGGGGEGARSGTVQRIAAVPSNDGMAYRRCCMK